MGHLEASFTHKSSFCLWFCSYVVSVFDFFMLIFGWYPAKNKQTWTQENLKVVFFTINRQIRPPSVQNI